MRELNSVKAEEMMKTRAFLVFKDRLIEYLRSFVKSLQGNVTAIELALREVRPETVCFMLEQVTNYEMSIPRIDVEADEQQIYERMKGRWENIQGWFIGVNGLDSEAGKVFDTTNEIIRKITRYATRISEQASGGSNRREVYQKLAGMFAECADLDTAHRLSAVVFGVEEPIHLKGNFARETDSINSGIFEEAPQVVTVMPRIRTYKEKAARREIEDRSREKEAVRRALIARQQEEQRLMKSYIRSGRLEFASLPELTPQVRDIFLSWLSKGLENKSHRAKTEDGQLFTILLEEPGKTCVLACTDGTFRMPAYTIVFDVEPGRMP